MSGFDFSKLAGILRNSWDNVKEGQLPYWASVVEAGVNDPARPLLGSSKAARPHQLQLAKIIRFPVERCTVHYVPPWHRADVIDLTAYRARKNGTRT